MLDGEGGSIGQGSGVREDRYSDSRAFAIAETAALEAIFFLIAWYISALNPSTGHHGWLPKVTMIALALLGIAIHRSPRRYGFHLRNPWKDLKWSLYILMIMLGFGGIIAYLCTLVGLGSLRRASLEELLWDAIWYLVMVGFAEELFFRGYVQSRLNEVFTREYRSLIGFRYEWHQGTLITAIFYFGLPHVLTDINPFTGDFSVGAGTILIAASACFLGLIFGVMREKTGNILLPTVTHFSIVFSTFSLLPSVAGGPAPMIASMAALFVFFLKPFQDLLNEEF